MNKKQRFAKTQEIANRNSHQRALDLYNSNPDRCLAFGNVIEDKFGMRVTDARNKKFCDHSCSAKYSNARRLRVRKSRGSCQNRGTPVIYRRQFCGRTCHPENLYKRYVHRWLAGEISGNTSAKCKPELSDNVRNWIFETRGTACELCGFDRTHPICGVPITQIDHIDGNRRNSKPEHLRVLCPNCHCMTETWGNRKNSELFYVSSASLFGFYRTQYVG
jgi:hypothetical protein